MLQTFCSRLTHYDDRRKISQRYDSRRKDHRNGRMRSAMAKPPSLGELEIPVLRCIWQEQPRTERQLWDLIREERSKGRTTVLRTIWRLEAKGLLVRIPGKGPVEFRAAVEKKRLLPAIVRRFVDRTLADSLGPPIACLADSDKFSAKDLTAPRAIARKIADDEKSS